MDVEKKGERKNKIEEEADEILRGNCDRNDVQI